MQLASRLWTTLITVLLAGGILSLTVGRSAFAIAPENVLVIYNSDPGSAGDGFQIADYYQQIRPGVHMASISGVDAILSGPFSEEVGGQDYLDVIRPQILAAIAAIPDTIDVIVTTKGMPLRINAGPKPAGYNTLKWKPYSSLESELTRVDSIDTIEKMGDQYSQFFAFPQLDHSLLSNPYWNKGVGDPEFNHVGSDACNEDMRLSSRLDGYSVASVQKSIDRAQNVFLVPFGHSIILDDTGAASVDQMRNGAGPGPGTFEVITGLYPDDGMTNPVPVLFDETNSAIVASSRPVIGYVSHGTNDGRSVGLSNNYLGEFVDGQFQAGEIQFELANGAVFHTHESFNAQSFDGQNTQDQGLVADWLERGGTAGLGHVAEPMNGKDNVTNEDMFYQMLLPASGADAAPGESGQLTFVEAAWRATRQLSYMNTVVGDPLMRFRAWLPGDANLDGTVEFNDFYTLEGNWLQPGSFDDGDFDGDGIVGENDFAILQDNWLSSVDLLPSSVTNIMVTPILDSETGWPMLHATFMSPANLDLDLDVDQDDLALLLASYGVDDGGDVDGDGDTDGADFLLWQQQFYLYTPTADFDIDAHVNANDLEIWNNSYAKNRGGDANGDGETSGLDFLAWQREVPAQSTSTVAATAQVPEPCSLLLLGMGAFLLASSTKARAIVA